MIKKLQQYPLFFLLLPVFFVFHGFVANHSFIRFMDCWSLLGIYTGAALILYALGWWLLKNRIKAALLSTYVMSFYLFFGALHDFFRQHGIFLHKYSILLPAFIILAVALILYWKKRRSPLTRITLFLNTLFIVYLFIDGCTLVWKISDKDTRRSGNYSAMPAPVLPCDNCPKPDIYFIIFDCYTSSKTLLDQYHFDNGPFDRFLEQQGFQIQKRSYSNYVYTPNSMASMLNLAYLGSRSTPDSIMFRDYKDLIQSIAGNRVANFLYSLGYTVVNYSPFDLPGHPSLQAQRFFPVNSQLITHGTLLSYMERDLQKWIEDHLEDSALLSGHRISDFDRVNRQFLAGTMEESKKDPGYPRFIYTHVFMPHFPFFYDSLLHRRTLSDVAAHTDEKDASYYLQYLPFTNACARDLITTIKRNSGGKAVIIFMSDHGFRGEGKGGNPSAKYAADNQNAIYFPDKDYRLFYDSISAVNEFRVVFNKLFRQNFPLLKDSVTLSGN
jgi:hypothetical protein